MASETTYTNLRGNLAGVLDRVVDDQEVVIVRRRGARDVALVPATELAGLMETAYLLRSPRNAKRLIAALNRAERSQGHRPRLSALGKSVGWSIRVEKGWLRNHRFRRLQIRVLVCMSEPTGDSAATSRKDRNRPQAAIAF